MDRAAKEKAILFIEKASLALLGGLFIIFPLFFTNITTDLFALPKQVLLIFVMSVVLILYGAKTLLAEKLTITRTPFDVPLVIFVVAVILSSVFSVALYDSLFNAVPLIFAVITFFAITYNTKNQKSLNALILSLLAGGALVSVITVLNLIKVYVFPFEFAKSQTFTTLGSPLDAALYLGLLSVLGLYYIYPFVRKPKDIFAKTKNNLQVLFLSLLTLFNLIGVIVSIYILIKLQPAVILPLATGFQTAFASISQDGARLVRGFLFGSGYGEFSISFLRFKQAAFNANADIWNLTFFRSTTFVLELLATTGLIGFLSFLYLIVKVVREKKPFIPMLIAIIGVFLLPFSFYSLVLFFIILAIDSATRNLVGNNNFYEVELSLMVSKRGFFVLSEGAGTAKFGRALTVIVFVVILLFTGIFSYLTWDFLNANINFQKSLVAAQSNNGSETYTFQTQALNSLTGRYVDVYHRVFSQTNLALANSLASSIPQNSSPSAQQQQTITSLVQQAINSGRSATTVSPLNAIDWQNLSSIYRSLIGFGQNADSFAILAAQQAETLDPTNPNEYINLGGIYYQLNAWDRAIEQFTTAATLKPDFANAYYNLGYAYWQKGDLQNAKSALEQVKSLVANDKNSLDQINSDIEKLEQDIASGGNGETPPIEENTSALPAQENQVKIPAPSPVVSPSTTQAPSPTPAK